MSRIGSVEFEKRVERVEMGREKNKRNRKPVVFMLTLDCGYKVAVNSEMKEWWWREEILSIAQGFREFSNVGN